MQLFLQTSGTTSEIGLSDGQKIISRSSFAQGKGTPDWSSAISSLLAGQKTDWKKISEIRIITGPGSFTGLRTMFTAAGVAAHELAIPLLGIDLLSLVLAQEKADITIFGMNGDEAWMQLRGEQKPKKELWNTLSNEKMRWTGVVPEQWRGKIPAAWKEMKIDLLQALCQATNLQPITALEPWYGAEPRIG